MTANTADRVYLLTIGIAGTALGVWGLVIVVWPDVTIEQVWWVVGRVIMYGVPSMVLAFGLMALMAAFATRKP